MPSPITIEVVRESLHFSAAHFTIFSATERENLHGHNFRVQALFVAELQDDGLVFDYGIVKQQLQALCDELDETFLVPSESPHLEIDQSSTTTTIQFNDETMTLPNRDIKLFPVRNITVEELAHWFSDALERDPSFASLGIVKSTLKVASGSGQWGVVTREYR